MTAVHISGTRRRLGESLRRARGLWRDLTGESAYEHYLLHHSREHPGDEPMGERQFWRERAREDETHVSSGCC